MDSGAMGGGAEQERTPADDVREYAQQVRSLPVEEVIADVLFSLLNAAQVKLGRRDARLLIDLSAVAHEHARPYLPGELTKQVDQVLGQLRLAQVSAEGHASLGKPEENDLDRVPAPPSAGGAQPSPSPAQPSPSPAQPQAGAAQPQAGAAQSPPSPPPSRLWVPGR